MALALGLWVTMMPDKLIRNVSDELDNAIKAAASDAGMNEGDWMIARLAEAAGQIAPAPRQYRLTALGPGSTKATIIRHSANAIGGGARDMSQAQADAYQRAKLLVGRNEPGDKDRAIELLTTVFAEVFEGAV